MNQIANETGVSKGKVRYVITDWKKKIGTSDFDEIRKFVNHCTKSNMSGKQCAHDFIMINILKNFGIQDDNNILDGDDTYDNNYNALSTFIEDAYKNCKVLGIPSAIIPLWIKDLMDCYSSSNPHPLLLIIISLFLR